MEKKIGFFNKIKSLDMTKGNIFWKMIVFALPIAFTTILQLLYTTVDLISVHFGDPIAGETSAAAISGNGALINLIIVMFSQMAVGANVAIGNAIGAKDNEHANKVMHTSLIFALFCGFVVGIFGYIMTPTLLKWIKMDSAYVFEATQYLRIYFIGLPFLMIYNYSGQIHRAIGDASTPFIVLMISGIANIGFDLLFVLLFKLGVKGVAWATVISEAVSAVLMVLSLIKRKDSPINLSFRKLKIDFSCLKEIIKIGLPAGIQGFCFALPNTFIQSALYIIGTGNLDLQNGAIAANNINNYNYAFIEAIYSVTMIVVAQNYGAKNKKNIKKAFSYGMIWMTIYCLIYILIIFIAYHPLLSLFVDYDNMNAIEAGKQRLWLVGFTYFLDGYMDTSASVMKGVRKSFIPAIVTLVTCTLFRICMIEFLILRVDTFKTVLWLYSVYPFSWTLACIANFTILPIVLKKTFKKFDLANAN